MHTISKEDFKDKLKDPLYIFKQEAARFVELAEDNGFRAEHLGITDEIVYMMRVSIKSIFQFSIKHTDELLLRELAEEAFGHRDINIVAVWPTAVLVTICTL